VPRRDGVSTPYSAQMVDSHDSASAQGATGGRAGRLIAVSIVAVLLWSAGVYFVTVVLLHSWVGFAAVLAPTVPFFIWEMGKVVRGRFRTS